MPVSEKEMSAWCEKLLAGSAAEPNLTLSDYIRAIPGMASLQDVPSGTAVLVRGDVDAKPGANIGDGDIRLRSMVDTLQFGQTRGWKQIVFGHIGRKPEGSLNKVAKRLGEIMKCDVPLIADWLDESTMTILPAAQLQIAAAKPGAILMLENTRKYDIERALWKAKSADVPKLSSNLAKLANEFADKLGKIFIFEAFSAGSPDACSVVVPAAMSKVALGEYVTHEFTQPLMRCLDAQLVVFSGLKADKLDDMEAMINRGKITRVIAAGALSGALRKAAAQLDGKECCLGIAEDPNKKDLPIYVPESRLEQARKMIAEGRKKGIKFFLPVDFVIQGGSVVDNLKPSDEQFDVGPKTNALFEEAVGEFLKLGGAVAFYNGVFGMFEDPRFEGGTKRFIPQIKRMTDSGVEVYVGGGEGGAALEKYGQENWATHVFTAGGTVLNALGSEPVPYMVALRAAALKDNK
ncbi:MAG TPA: phosphoglycerate kinase [Lacipirellulaceae bacterium]|jgi:phosphoglycerate kinase|nr:phosphoglycerate kinase [Lacipirellulaceae bacterium]